MDLLTAFVKMVSALAIVLGLMALTAYLFRKYLNPKLGGAGGGMLLRVKGTIPLGVKKEIALVEVGGKILVVGVTPTQISLLCEMEPERMAPPASPETRPMGIP